MIAVFALNNGVPLGRNDTLSQKWHWLNNFAKKRPELGKRSTLYDFYLGHHRVCDEVSFSLGNLSFSAGPRRIDACICVPGEGLEGREALEHWNVPNHLEPQISLQVLFIFGPKNGPRWSFSTLTPPLFVQFIFLGNSDSKMNKDNLEQPDLPLLCCFYSFSCKLSRIFLFYPLLYPFLDIQGTT